MTTIRNSLVTVSRNADWLRTFRRYILFTAIANLVWEFAQLPLYTIWETGSVSEMTFAVIHCTGGDVLIASSALLTALCLFGNFDWPNDRYREVLYFAVSIGLSYTILSEWLNIEIRKSWAYSDLMPVVPVINAGLSPVLQWIIIPIVGLWWSKKPSHLKAVL